MKIRRPNLRQLHVEFAADKARQRHFKLRVREEEDTLALKLLFMSGQSALCALAGSLDNRLEARVNDAELPGSRLEPKRRPFLAEREVRRNMLGAALLQVAGGVGQKRLGEKKMRIFAEWRKVRTVSRREEANALQSEILEEPGKLVFNHIRQRANNHKRRRCVTRFCRQLRYERGKASVFALREGGLDSAARVVENADLAGKVMREAFCRAMQIELDDFRRARADEEEHLDVGAALQKAGHHAVQLFVEVCKACEIALIDDGGCKTRFGKNHDAGRGLDEMRAGSGSDDQKERVLYLTMQPDDARQPAEDLALTTLAENRALAGLHGRSGSIGAHWAISGSSLSAASRRRASSSRAARSFNRNCAAFIT